MTNISPLYLQWLKWKPKKVFESATGRYRGCKEQQVDLYLRSTKGALLRDLMMGAAKATYEEAWNVKMAEIRALDKGDHDWLLQVPKACWCKHAFSFYPRCDVLMKNLSEAFNITILVARDMPIITLCEWIRRYLMGRFATLREKLSKHQGIVMPKPRKRLDREIEKSGNWFPSWGGGSKFEITHMPSMDKFVVDLGARTCSCNYWELVGIPCRHAVAAINYNKEEPEETSGLLLRTLTSCRPNTRGSGRPRKLRRREPDEGHDSTRLRRQGTRYRCGTCNEQGHNSHTCVVRKSILRMLSERGANETQPANETQSGFDHDAPPGFEPQAASDATLAPCRKVVKKRASKRKQVPPRETIITSQPPPATNEDLHSTIGSISESQPVKGIRKRKILKGSTSNAPNRDFGEMASMTVAQMVQNWINLMNISALAKKDSREKIDKADNVTKK